MFTDMNISTGLNNDFSDFLKKQNVSELGVNFSISVLQVNTFIICKCQSDDETAFYTEIKT